MSIRAERLGALPARNLGSAIVALVEQLGSRPWSEAEEVQMPAVAMDLRSERTKKERPPAPVMIATRRGRVGREAVHRVGHLDVALGAERPTQGTLRRYIMDGVSSWLPINGRHLQRGKAQGSGCQERQQSRRRSLRASSGTHCRDQA